MMTESPEFLLLSFLRTHKILVGSNWQPSASPTITTSAKRLKKRFVSSSLFSSILNVHVMYSSSELFVFTSNAITLVLFNP